MIYDTPDLLPINFNDEMEKENKADAKKLMENVILINDITKDINMLINDSKESLETTDKLIEKSDIDVKKANINLENAKYHHFKSKLWKTSLFNAFIGFIISGPLGGIIGVGTGISAIGLGISSALFGGATTGAATYGVIKNKIKNLS